MKIVDIHCHILSGIDDGSSDMYESLSMAKLAESNGIAAIVSTPHSIGFNYPGFYEDPVGYTEMIRENLHDLRDALKEEEVDVKIAPGMELMIDRDISSLVDSIKFITLNKSDYLLIEFEFNESPPFMTDAVHLLVKNGYRPVIAHPERYFCFNDEPKRAAELIKTGGFLQVNANSLTGDFGQTVRDTAFSLLENGFVSVLASDAHSFTYRTPEFRDVIKLLNGLYENNVAERLLSDNPLAIIRNQNTQFIIPKKVNG